MASFGAGNMFQANQTCEIIYGLVHAHAPSITPLPVKIVVGSVLVILASLVIIGGIKRIGAVASKLVPSMCIIYVGGALIIIGMNIAEVPALLWTIVHDAFTGTAATGAFFGVATREAVIQGIRRACFSNEAGLGSAPMAHATAKTNESIREGVVAGIGPFIDTIVICTMTALVIMLTGVHERPQVGTLASVSEARVVTTADGTAVNEIDLVLDVTDEENAMVGDDYFVQFSEPGAEGDATTVQFRLGWETDAGQWVAVIAYPDTPEGREQMAAELPVLHVDRPFFLHRDGVRLTAYAFDQQLRGFGTYFIPFAAFLFAFSTMISWSFYGETCTEYLFGEKALMPFRFCFVSMIMVGSLFGLAPVVNWSDAMLGLMLVPNLIGTIALLPQVRRAHKSYFRKLDAGEFQYQADRAAAHKASKKNPVR
jgi:AGCS family alanine or glycine:cation symporter